MANKHMKKHSISHIIREFQIKTVSYHYIPVRMATVLMLATPNADKYVGQQELSFAAGTFI